MEGLGFYLFGALAVLGSLLMVSRKNPIYAVLWLVVAFIGLSGLFGSLGADFLAAIQILVYAGAILVLFLFVIMLLNLRPADIDKIPALSWRGWFGGLLIGIGGFAFVGFMVISGSDRFNVVIESLPDLDGGAAAVGISLFDQYLLPFEVVSLLLLAAIVGSVALTKRKLT
ncbi:MAG: NADH-quinone oxidoreductase subunit J [Planctomycetota bacterium]|jgi:NADH-quinone oxidoreductase subunit J